MPGPAEESFRLEDRGAGRFALAGVVGFPTAATLLERSKKLFDGQTSIEIDLSGVTQTDSAGLALLIEWLNWAKHYDRQVRFVNLPEQLQAIARISEVEDLLEVAPRP